MARVRDVKRRTVWNSIVNLIYVISKASASLLLIEQSLGWYFSRSVDVWLRFRVPFSYQYPGLHSEDRQPWIAEYLYAVIQRTSRLYKVQQMSKLSRIFRHRHWNPNSGQTACRSQFQKGFIRKMLTWLTLPSLVSHPLNSTRFRGGGGRSASRCDNIGNAAAKIRVLWAFRRGVCANECADSSGLVEYAGALRGYRSARGAGGLHRCRGWLMNFSLT